MGPSPHDLNGVHFNSKPQEDQVMKLVPVGKAEKTIVIAAGIPWPTITLEVRVTEDDDNPVVNSIGLPSVRWFAEEDTGRKRPLCQTKFQADGICKSEELIDLGYGHHKVIASLSSPYRAETSFIVHIRHDINPVVTIQGHKHPVTGQVEARIPFNGMTSKPLTLTTFQNPGNDPEPLCPFVITATQGILFSARFNENYCTPVVRLVGKTDSRGRFEFLLINDQTINPKIRVATRTTERVFRLPVEAVEDPPLGPLSFSSSDGERTEDIPVNFSGGDEVSIPLDTTDPGSEFLSSDPDEDVVFSSGQLESLTLDETATGEWSPAASIPSEVVVVERPIDKVVDPLPIPDEDMEAIEAFGDPELEDAVRERDEYGATASVFFMAGEAMETLSADDEEPPSRLAAEEELFEDEPDWPEPEQRSTSMYILLPVAVVVCLGVMITVFGPQSIWSNLGAGALGGPYDQATPEDTADDGDVFEEIEVEPEEAANDAEWLMTLTPESTPTDVADADFEEIEINPEEPVIPTRETLPGCWWFTGVNMTEHGLNVRSCLDPKITTTCLGFYHKQNRRVAPYGCFSEPPPGPPAECHEVAEEVILGKTWVFLRNCTDGIDRKCIPDVDPESGAYKFCLEIEPEESSDSPYCQDYQAHFDVDGVPYLIMTGCPDDKTYRCLAAPDNLDSSGQFLGNCSKHTL